MHGPYGAHPNMHMGSTRTVSYLRQIGEARRQAHVYKKGSSAIPSQMASKVKTDFPGVDPSVVGGNYFIGYSCKYGNA